MITISNLNFTYSDSENPVLKRLNLQVHDGEFMLLTGPTGSGKTSLLMAIAGLAPSFTGGKASGSIEIDGKQRLGATAQSLSADVAFVNQQPESSFVAESVIDELAFGLEQFGVEPSKIRELVAQIAKMLDLERLLNRETAQLSGGEQQKIAIAAALAGNKKILLLDEPTSALDSTSAEAVISTLKDLNQKHGYTVIVSEHRFDHLKGVVDSVATVQSDGTLRKAMAGTKEFALATSNAADTAEKKHLVGEKLVAILGANGSGKSTLLWKMQAELGAVLVPQRASDLLYLQTVAAEFSESDAASSKSPGSTGALFESLVGRVDPKIHPRDLSAGQQLALALSVQLVRDESVILLDEPTRGLDMKAKTQLAIQLRKLQASGKKIVVATHDREFATTIADELIGISKGDLESELLIGGKTFTGTKEVRAQV